MRKERKPKTDSLMTLNRSVGGYIPGGGIRTIPHNLALDIKRNRVVYLLLLLVLAYFIIFCYIPMGGLLMAFEKFSPAKGIFFSKWVGLKNFETFFSGPYVGRLIRNTVAIGVLDLIVNFTAPIIFALILNEISFKPYKRVIQTISYMPHFISAVVACGIVILFTQSGGLISELVATISNQNSMNLLNQKQLFWLIYVMTNLWQGVGYGSIIYLSALSSIDPSLYEASVLDGANRWKQTLNITLPGIAPMIIMMLILRMGSMFSVGAEKILLLYSPAIYEYADVINTYVYRLGLMNNDYGVSTAVGLFNSIIGTIMLLLANKAAKKFSGISMF